MVTTCKNCGTCKGPFRLPHRCDRNSPPCPSRSRSGIEIPSAWVKTCGGGYRGATFPRRETRSPGRRRRAAPAGSGSVVASHMGRRRGSRHAGALLHSKLSAGFVSPTCRCYLLVTADIIEEVNSLGVWCFFSLHVSHAPIFLCTTVHMQFHQT